MVKHWGGSLYHKAATRVIAGGPANAILGQHNRLGFTKSLSEIVRERLSFSTVMVIQSDYRWGV